MEKQQQKKNCYQKVLGNGDIKSCYWTHSLLQDIKTSNLALVIGWRA